jgi:hypothetical protein
MTVNAKPDAERLARILSRQYDVIARRQALACGMTAKGLKHKLRTCGPWRKILPGVYVTVTGTVTPEQREMAALLYAGPRSVITGAAAVRRHRLDCPGLNEVDILVPVGVRRQSAGFVRIQHTARMPANAWTTRALRFAPLARAVADAARGMKRFSDVQAVVCEAVQRGGCGLDELIDELDAGPTAGSRWYREALAEVSAGIRSAAERDLKRAIDRSDIEPPMYNPRLYTLDGVFLGIPDAWWQDAGVAAEVDSRQYHIKAKEHEATIARHNRMEGAGIHMLHFLPGTIVRDRRSVLVTLRDAIDAGRRNPQLPIVAVPAEGVDDGAHLGDAAHSVNGGHLIAQVGSLQGT